MIIVRQQRTQKKKMNKVDDLKTTKEKQTMENQNKEAVAPQATPKKITLITFSDNAYSIKGRASRKEFWFAILFGIIQNVILNAIVFLLFILTEDIRSAVIIAIPAGVIYLVRWIPATVCLCVRRLHDIGIGGSWAFLLFLLAPFVFIASVCKGLMFFLVLALSLLALGKMEIGVGLWVILHLAVFLFLGLYPSQKGANKYDLVSAEEE